MWAGRCSAVGRSLETRLPSHAALHTLAVVEDGRGERAEHEQQRRRARRLVLAWGHGGGLVGCAPRCCGARVVLRTSAGVDSGASGPGQMVVRSRHNFSSWPLLAPLVAAAPEAASRPAAPIAAIAQPAKSRTALASPSSVPASSRSSPATASDTVASTVSTERSVLSMRGTTFHTFSRERIPGAAVHVAKS